MSEHLSQREPGPVAIQKGLDALLAGLNAREESLRWRVASPPHRVEGAGAMGAGDVDGAGIVRPHDQGTVLDGSTADSPADEDVADHPAKEVA